jgi:hypothetical protein
MTPLLPLDIWRQEIGMNPWLFWGLADGVIIKDDSKCSGLVREYSWQGSDAAGRDDLRRAIERAEEKLLGYLNFRVAPQYIEETVNWPRFNDVSMTRRRDLDATGRRIATLTTEGYVQALGIEQLTLIGQATTAGGTLVYSDVFGTGFNDTFTITLPTTATDPAQIAVYFVAADRFDDTAVGARWRIEPLQISIAGGNVTIVGRRWLVVRPILYQTPTLNAINPTNAANFVTALDVYQRTTNENGTTVDTCQAKLIYESNDCGAFWGPCWCAGGPPASSDPGTIGAVVARAGIRDKRLGLVTPAAATYDPTTAAWSSAWCCGSFCEPDRVTLRYLAGWPLESGQMAKKWQEIDAMLATAELKRRICACRETNERLHDLQVDLTLESTQTERFAVAQRDLESPFGTRLGHVLAWKQASNYILRRGMLA